MLPGLFGLVFYNNKHQLTGQFKHSKNIHKVKWHVHKVKWLIRKLYSVRIKYCSYIQISLTGQALKFHSPADDDTSKVSTNHLNLITYF